MSRWANIMTTSMNTPSNPWGMVGPDEAPGELPDVRELTRLANEFYSTPPGSSTAPGARVTGKPSGGPNMPPSGIGESAPWSSPASAAFGTPYNVPDSAASAHVPPPFAGNHRLGIPGEVPGPDVFASNPSIRAGYPVAPEGPYGVPPSASASSFSKTPAPSPVAPRGPYGVPPSAAAAPVPRTHARSAVAPEGPYHVPPSASASPFSKTPAPSPVAPRGPYGVPPSAAAAPVPRTDTAASQGVRAHYAHPQPAAAAPAVTLPPPPSSV